MNVRRKLLVLGEPPPGEADAEAELASLRFEVLASRKPLTAQPEPAMADEASLVVLQAPAGDPDLLFRAAERWRSAVTAPLLLIVTADVAEHPDFVRQALSFDYLVRPFSRQALRAAVETTLARQAARAGQPPKPEINDGLVGETYDLTCTHDMEGRLLSVNAAAEKALGYPQGSLIGRNLQELIVPEVRHLFPRYLEEIRQNGMAHGILRLRTARGEVCEWEYHNFERRRPDGTRFVRGLAHDVTRQVKAARALRESERRFRALFEQAAIGVLQVDRDTKQILSVNRKCVRILGYNPEELLNIDFCSLVHPDDVGANRSLLDSLRRGEAPELAVEQRLLCKDRSVVWVALSVSPLLRNEAGSNLLMVILQDITQRKRTERTLVEKERLLSLSQRIARVGSFSIEYPHETTVWTEECYRLHGQSPETFRPSLDAAMKLLHPDDAPRMYEWFASHFKGRKPGPAEFRVRLPDGTFRHLSAVGEIFFNDDGSPRRFIGTVRDITEQKQADEQRAVLEAQLRQAQKMEAIGTLAGGIAHDFNNLLTTMVGNIELARQDLEPGHPVMEFLDAAAQAARRGTELVRQILAFSRKQPVRRAVIDLASVIEDAARLLRASLPASIDLRLKLTPTPPVLADPTQIHQVVMNLCTNAWHAIGPGPGTITVRLGTVHISPKDPPGRAPPGRYAQICVDDTGEGIEPQTLERIFEPFFTTKEVGRGSGLGLSVALGIVKEHGGTITAESHEGRGATFEVLLPLAERRRVPRSAQGEAPPPAPGRGHVLYVDDEPALGATVGRLLTSLGYETTVCSTGTEALEQLRAHPERFDVVLTDFSMPGPSGVDVAREVARIRPGLPVILTSGYAERAGENLEAAGIRYRLDKPFDRATLADALRRVLETREADRPGT